MKIEALFLLDFPTLRRHKAVELGVMPVPEISAHSIKWPEPHINMINRTRQGTDLWPSLQSDNINSSLSEFILCLHVFLHLLHIVRSFRPSV